MAMLEKNYGPGDSRTVLVVEDDAGVQRVAAFMLQNLGFEVSLAKNGPEALALLPWVCFSSCCLPSRVFRVLAVEKTCSQYASPG